MPTSFQPGDVILVRFPFTDLSATKLRPAVVLAIHDSDLIILGVFSTVPGVLRGSWVQIRTTDPAFGQTGLRTDSVVKGERIAVVENSVVVRRIGVLSTSQMSDVRQAVKTALNLI